MLQVRTLYRARYSGGVMVQDQRWAELLVLAQQAQAKANKELNPGLKKGWEVLAGEYRRLAEIRAASRV